MGLRELCRCGRRPRRGGRCRLGEPRYQGAVIREGEELGRTCHALPLGGPSRRRPSAAIVAPRSGRSVYIIPIWGAGSSDRSESVKQLLPAPSLSAPLPFPAKDLELSSDVTV